ncbi:hypothetical protein BLNAU_2062 [Blattamonas nauphoetae]|uniref:Right handed beta helix domain-containing protein n=1 Tax=Blattamonas nauphoetae TaxID=2049346 RepID=A0ABQ9YH03_9EUKA|nr:hypothetical protein BLNAU_2062 [Blattamonas nauphoetae]
MLGCVVSLTSSHLSGSTIRDVITGGSVLCSNSSFSSLLSSPNTDTESNEEPSIVLPDGSTPPFVDGTLYFFDKTSGPSSTSASFSHCRFTGDNYQPSARPLIFNKNPGTLSVESCSFDNITFTGGPGGAITIVVTDQLDDTNITVILSNFTSCTSKDSGGAMHLSIADDVLIESCRFVYCSTTASSSDGGGLYLSGYYLPEQVVGKKLELVGCVFEDCKAVTVGGGVAVAGQIDLSVVGTKFERCRIIAETSIALGGGIEACGGAKLTVKRSHFIGCSSKHGGSAISFHQWKELSSSDTLVKNCFSGTTGAICIITNNESESLSFSRVFFDGNTICDDTSFFMENVVGLEANATKFTDVAIMFFVFPVLPPLEFDDCFTTISRDSTGMILGDTMLESVVGCLLIKLLLVVIILIFLRRRKQKSVGLTQNKMEPQEPLDVEKVEEFGVDDTHGVILVEERMSKEGIEGSEADTGIAETDEGKEEETALLAILGQATHPPPTLNRNLSRRVPLPVPNARTSRPSKRE